MQTKTPTIDAIMAFAEAAEADDDPFYIHMPPGPFDAMQAKLVTETRDAEMRHAVVFAGHSLTVLGLTFIRRPQ